MSKVQLNDCIDCGDLFTGIGRVCPKCKVGMVKRVMEGYHRRIDGAATGIIEGYLECEICGRKVKNLEGYEKEYPKYPDLNVCSRCSEDFEEKYAKRENT